MITPKKVKEFLNLSSGYLKKSPLETAKAIWKKLDKTELPRTGIAVQKDLEIIKKIQRELRNNINSSDTSEIDVNSLFNFKERKVKRLFFDIETSPNIVFSWNVGRKINLDVDNIIQERAIICIAYKFEGESKTQCLTWNNGDDKELLEKFAKVMDSADEVCGHNSDSYDIKWVRARCIFHRIPISSKLNSIDTLKLARKQFRFNSNKLNYISQFLNIGEKIHTDFDLWKNIVMKNDKSSLQKMSNYCKKDVELLEDVYHEIERYSPKKKVKYVK